MKVLFLAAVLAVVLSASSGQTLQELREWEMYKIKHMKDYSKEEEVLRRNTFLKSLNEVRQHNLRHDQGEVSHRSGINQFSDMTREEMATSVLGCRRKPTSYRRENTTHVYTYDDVPKTVDWRKKGAVTKVKKQGHCGSCWAYAATGSLEGMNFVKTGKLVPLSVQNLLDCDSSDQACHGGFAETAYSFISKNGGIDTEASYPYEGRKDECRFKSSTVGATVTGHVVIPKGDEEQLKQVVATKGPVTVAIDGTQIYPYLDGVFENCTKVLDTNHVVVVVGYGTTDEGKDYWLIKNSWDTTWGMEGFMMLARGKNVFGVAEEAVYPLV